MWALLLVACANPISNRLFAEDATFLAALPSSERFGPPEDVRVARVGTSPVLAAGVAAAAEVEGWTSALAASGDALRAEIPDDRGELVRSWTSTTAAGRVDGASQVWFVRGAVIRPEEGDVTWTIALSADGEEPWIDVGEGRHDPGGFGEVSWDLAAVADTLGLAPVVGGLHATYDDVGWEDEAVAATYTRDDGVPRTIDVGGAASLGWTGELAITADGAAWTGTSELVHVAGVGGRASGVLFTAEGDLAWEACWDAQGDEVWRAGDGAIVPSGATDACPL